MDGTALPGHREPWRRVVFAVFVSAGLHAGLVLLLPVKPARHQGSPGVALQARLMAAALGPERAVPPATGAIPKRAEPAPELPKPIAEPPRPAPEAPAEPVPESEASRAPPAIEGPPGIPVPQIEDPEFYPSRLLDEYPKPVAEVVLRYPQKAEAEELSGTVTLLLLIDDLGMVVEASVVEADPPGYFEEAAIEAFKAVLFTPGQRNGHAVKSRLVVQVAFDAKTESLRR